MTGAATIGIVIPMAVPEQTRRYSWQDYLSWPTEERFELIEGIPLAMSPAPSREHQRLVSSFHYHIYDALRDSPCEVYPAPFDVKLSGADADDAPTVVQPDLTVVCDESKLSEHGAVGPPDLVVEVVSPDSGYHDRSRKFELYLLHGVREYWIVDVAERVVEVYRLTGTSYERVGAFGSADRLQAAGIPELFVDLAQALNR